MKRLPIAVLVLAAACSGKGACAGGRDASGRAEGQDSVLYFDGIMPLSRYDVVGSSHGSVTATLFGATKTLPADRTISLGAIFAEAPPRPGDLVVVRTSDRLWDVALFAGSDGANAYLREPDRVGRYEKAKVFRAPDASAGLFTDVRRGCELAARTYGWVPDRPRGWVPKPGELVLVRERERWRTSSVAEVRGSIARADEWLSVLRLAPRRRSSDPPAVAGDVVVAVGSGREGLVESANETAVTVLFTSGTRGEIAHDGYVLLRPPGVVWMPVTPASELGVIERSEAMMRLAIELGGVDTRLEEAAGRMAFIDASGAELVGGHVELVRELDERGGTALDYESAAAAVEQRGASFLSRSGRRLYAVFDPRLASGTTAPGGDALSAQSRELLAVLSAQEAGAP